MSTDGTAPPQAGEGSATPAPASSGDSVSAAILAELRAINARLAKLERTTVAPDAPTMTIAQTQEALGCGRSKVHELLAEGRLHRAKRVGRRVRVTRASVEAVLAASGHRNGR